MATRGKSQQEEKTRAEVKLVFVGDGATGKTSCLITYTEGKLPTEYIPTVFDNYEYFLEKKQVTVSLWDTGGREGYARIRTLSYPKTDCFIITFSVDSHLSLLNVEDKWVNELRRHCPNVSLLLVATKIDLRTDPNTIARLRQLDKTPIGTEEGQKVAPKIRTGYF